MKYRIEKGNSGRYLYGFHSNGGWKVGDVFVYKQNGNIIFHTREEAEEYIIKMKAELYKQEARWGAWLDVAIKEWRKLQVKSYEHH
jgi:hypothetical protein